MPFLNKSASIHPIDEIFTKREQNEMKKKMEPIRPVHLPWIEISKDNDVKWAPDGTDKYDNSGGGGVAGPSSAMLEIARTAKSLADIFMFMVPFSFFEQVSTWTEKYAYKDWVIEKVGRDRDGNPKTRRHFKDVPAKKGRRIYPGWRH